MTIDARPFAKMAGGKTKLLPEIFARMPKTFGGYYEPFVGGGALFFALRSREEPRSFVIGDTNTDLIAAYRAVRDEPRDLIRRLRGMKNNETFFYKVRDIDIDDIASCTPGKECARAARFLYLNKTCFNGLHRENRAGKFNVPFGRYSKPNICDEPNILACSKALRGVRIAESSFFQTSRTAIKGDFVYFDPPYLPISETGNFTNYGHAGFGWSHHVELYQCAIDLKKRGVHVMISNSASPKIIELYKSNKAFTIHEVHAARSINASGDGRGKIKELLIF